MKTAFQGFSPEAAAFFRGLRKNNNREWFQPRKSVFEEKVKAPMLALVDALNGEMVRFAPGHVTEPSKAVYRIYRDTRFSHDKTPYKTHIAATFPLRGAQKHGAAGFYCAVSDTEVAVGGGLYLPEPAELLALRNHLAGNHAEFLKIVNKKDVRTLLGEVHGEKLSRVPKGFCADHPAAELLKYKRILLYTTLDAAMITTPAVFTEILKRFRAMTPFLDFLNRPLSGRGPLGSSARIEE